MLKAGTGISDQLYRAHPGGGSIVDRSGTALVQDDTVYDLALCVPAPPDTEMAQTLQTLKELT